MISPIPEWLFCEDSDGERQFIFHTTAPAFVAEIFDADDPDGVLDSLTVGLNNGQALANIVWYDDSDRYFSQSLLRRLNSAIKAYDKSL